MQSVAVKMSLLPTGDTIGDKLPGPRIGRSLALIFRVDGDDRHVQTTARARSRSRLNFVPFSVATGAAIRAAFIFPVIDVAYRVRARAGVCVISIHLTCKNKR